MKNNNLLSNLELVQYIESSYRHVRVLRIYLHQNILGCMIESRISSVHEFLSMLEVADTQFLTQWEMIHEKHSNIIFFTKK